MGNNEASNMREGQKAHEAGLGENVAQFKEAEQEKSESVNPTEAADGKVIKKEDEEEKDGNSKKKKKKAKKADEKDKSEPKKPNHPKIPDSVRGFKVDLKV